MSKELQTVRLKGVALHADFRKSESTLWDEWRKKHKTELRKNEVVLFISGGRDQLLFVLNIQDVDPHVYAHSHYGRDEPTAAKPRTGVRVLDTRRWRIIGGSWNPDMLQNYAHEVGLDFQGVKRFEELYAERRLRKMLVST